jgi:hypothetical protein
MPQEDSRFDSDNSWIMGLEKCVGSEFFMQFALIVFFWSLLYIGVILQLQFYDSKWVLKIFELFG